MRLFHSALEVCHFPKAFPQVFLKTIPPTPEGRRSFSAYGMVTTLSKSFSA